MPTTDERLASLEARMDRINDLFTLVEELRSEMRSEMRELRAEVRGDIAGLRTDMNRRFEALDAKVDRDFRTLVGVQMATMVAVIGALIGAYYR